MDICFFGEVNRAVILTRCFGTSAGSYLSMERVYQIIVSPTVVQKDVILSRLGVRAFSTEAYTSTLGCRSAAAGEIGRIQKTQNETKNNSLLSVRARHADSYSSS